MNALLVASAAPSDLVIFTEDAYRGRRCKVRHSSASFSKKSPGKESETIARLQHRLAFSTSQRLQGRFREPFFFGRTFSRFTRETICCERGEDRGE